MNILIPIHLMPDSVKELAKNALHAYAPKRSVFNIPNTLGIGIGEGHIKVTVSRKHALHHKLPTEINGVPVVIEEQPPITFHALQGGLPVIANDTMFGVVVDSGGNKFLMGAAHSFSFVKSGQVTYNGAVVGQFTRSAMSCGMTANHLDAAIAAVAPGVQTSFDVIGLGTPKGISNPRVGDFANMQGRAGGRRRGRIIAVNYDYNNDYSQFWPNCHVQQKDLFQAANMGIEGDSGGCVWDDQGYVIGIHFMGQPQGGLGIQGCSKYMLPDLGVHLGVGSSSPIALPALPADNSLLLLAAGLTIGFLALK